MLWEVDLFPASDHPDRLAERLAKAAEEAGLAKRLEMATARGFLLQDRSLDRSAITQIVKGLLGDCVVERSRMGRVGEASLAESPQRLGDDRNIQLVHVLPKPGVMDPVARSAEAAIADLGYEKPLARTFKKYWFADLDRTSVERLANRLLANDAIEQVVVGPLELKSLDSGSDYAFQLRTVSVAHLDDDALMRLSREGQLYLQLAEMQELQRFFAALGRDPTDIELETLAQTWSEHCSHKTLAGRIAYRDDQGERCFENMLKETIFAATCHLRERWKNDPGREDWCVSVFVDNAGVVRFDDDHNVAFKVETHNHPSALEPYGGANTGLGGVIRDTLGTGMGAKPVCSTDVFCFAPPDISIEDLPPGVLHPRRVLQGVVEGVRDYGNRMGIPTVNGAVYFDPNYLGNPLVYCGNVGILPCDKTFKKPLPNDLIIALGGRTGRDGIHGATFSSAELTEQSEELSGGAVQIGNAIEEKCVADVLLAARDEGLYNAVTDCGAGGFSSAVGEMGEAIGAEVWLEKAPLKYAGLSYDEIWISEAQERMVLAVSEEQWPALEALCRSEGVEATLIGRFKPTGRLSLRYEDQVVGDLPMEFLHDGRPPVVRQAVYQPKPIQPLAIPERLDYTADLLKILASPNVASKEGIIRQYDHEVQGGSVVKPLVGLEAAGPSDAAVVRPKLDSRRGLVIGCGMNPRYAEFDAYDMAASAIDEAVRNCVAVGADPTRIALLDNFCWGDCERPEALGALVRAALACHDLSLILETPFISGKDSLNNEFSYFDSEGVKRTIAIPHSLLISAMGQIADVSRCVTMDFKQAGNPLYVIGLTRNELGGSHFALVNDHSGGAAPKVDAPYARQIFQAVHRAIETRTLASCHDMSEGGVAVAVAEMAFAGGLGAQIDLGALPVEEPSLSAAERLFSESNTRFVCEVLAERRDEFEALMKDVPLARVGEVSSVGRVRMQEAAVPRIDAPLADLKEVWQATVRF